MRKMVRRMTAVVKDGTRAAKMAGNEADLSGWKRISMESVKKPAMPSRYDRAQVMCPLTSWSVISSLLPSMRVRGRVPHATIISVPRTCCCGAAM